MTKRIGGPSRRRTAGSRKPRKRLLLLLERRVTERIYFNGVKSLLRHGPAAIEIGGHSGEPLGLVKAAIKQRRASTDPFDETWCVIDVEAPNPQPSLPEALRLAEQNQIHCALTNPCFELWLLWHFQDFRRTAVSDEMCGIVSAHLPGYSDKAKSFDFAAVHPGIDQAHERARALDAWHERLLPHANPASSVWRLMDALGWTSDDSPSHGTIADHRSRPQQQPRR